MPELKILLINPPFEADEAVGESRSVKFVLNITPPLGLAYLASSLEQAGHRAKIVDLTSRYRYPPLDRLLAEFKPDLIGMTATTPSFPGTCRLAEKIRAISPGVPLLVGGAHVTCSPESAMATGFFDAGIIGEGEETLLEIAERFGGGKFERLEDVKGVIFRRDGRWFRTPRRPFTADLDSLPPPAYHLLPPLSHYHPTPASYRKLPVGILMTSRGCPFRCTFCDRAIFGNRVRFHGPKRVIAEFDSLVNEHGAKEIRFFDDTFTLDRERTLAVCAELERRGGKIPWTCLTAVSAVNPEVLTAMKRAGCWQVLFGLESGDDRMLKILGKGNTVEANRRGVAWARAAGLEVRADFIVGTPGETMESLENTLRFTLENELDYAHFNKFTPFPGTELYSRLTDEGYRFDFSGHCSILDHGALLYVPPTLDPDEYRAWLDRAFKRFYLRPGYILRRLKAVRTWTQFKGQARGSLSILGL